MHIFRWARWEVYGLDSNQRAVFFGPAGDTRGNQHRLKSTLSRFTHQEVDIRDRPAGLALMADLQPDAITHTADQPSHNRAAAIPFDDFETNAVGTINLLKSASRHVPTLPFVQMSTNKVYGDATNELPLIEVETR